ncbi:MAG: hypothetical protein GX153_12955, partial [Clostridiaceae bacterium]|nr:hypothetical protein [Clostridiaceae bacterium]
MKRKKMENKLNQVFNRASDGLIKGILADCHKERMLMNMNTQKQNGSYEQFQPAPYIARNRNTRRPRRRLLIALATTAAALVLVIGVLFVFQQMGNKRVDSIVTLDVNPSVQLDINRKDQVIKAISLNGEAEIVLAGMNLEKTDLTVAVNAIIGSMMQKGYLVGDINAFLISVNNKSEEKAVVLQAQVANQLEGLMVSGGVEGLILSQKIQIDEQVTEMAEQYGISTGKAYLLRYIHTEHPAIPIEVLSSMEIGELAELFSHTIAQDDDIELFGKMPDDDQKQEMEQAAVLEMLYEHWKLDASNILYTSTKRMEGERPTFEVEIDANGKKYRAVVDAKTGEIVLEEILTDPTTKPTTGATTQPSDPMKPTTNPTTKPTAGPTTQPTINPTTKPTAGPSTKPALTTATETRMLSAADARQMVLNRFGGIVQKIEYNYDDRNPLYKGEALKEGRKVVFEINARTSEWYKWDEGNDNSWDSFAQAIPEMITMDQAARSVIERSGQANTFVQKIDFLWDDE